MCVMKSVACTSPPTRSRSATSPARIPTAARSWSSAMTRGATPRRCRPTRAFLCKHMFMPILEPSTNQEMKDWVDIAFKLSRESELYIAYLVTTNQADGGGLRAGAPQSFPAPSHAQPDPARHQQGRFREERPCCRRAPGAGSKIFPNATRASGQRAPSRRQPHHSPRARRARRRSASSAPRSRIRTSSTRCSSSASPTRSRCSSSASPTRSTRN